jgi:hypothetical protein
VAIGAEGELVAFGPLEIQVRRILPMFQAAPAAPLRNGGVANAAVVRAVVGAV